MANKAQLEAGLYPTWRDLYSDSEEAQQEAEREAIRDLEKELARYKTAFRRSNLPREAARYIAEGIQAMEQLLKESPA